MNLFSLILQIPIILITITLHEFTRAALSTAFGDKKPKEQGRVTLNPIKHFEPIGFILMFATGGFGWGKPVETSSLYYKNRKTATLLTAILPLISNLILAWICLFSVKHFLSYGLARSILSLLASYNITFAVYNLVPVSPMDGVKVMNALMPANTYFKYLQYEKIIQMVFFLLLFMGITDFIIVPIQNFVYLLIRILAF